MLNEESTLKSIIEHLNRNIEQLKMQRDQILLPRSLTLDFVGDQLVSIKSCERYEAHAAINSEIDILTRQVIVLEME